MRLSASMTHLPFYFVSLNYSLGCKLERRNCHLVLQLTSLQLWEIEYGVQVSFFLIFNHL